MAGNYPTKSVISSSDWQRMESIFRRLKKVCLDVNFPIDYVWQNIPVGEYLERVRQLRCEEKLTHDQMRFFDKLGIDLQYRERHWYYMYERPNSIMSDMAICLFQRRRTTPYRNG